VTDDDTDPVAASMSGTTDLYDIAEWDPRSRLDGVAVGIYGVLHASRRWLLIAVAVLLFVVQLAATILLAVRRPELGVLAALSAVPALGIVGFLWYGDPTMREPLEPLAITFVLAILFASIAAVVNTLLQPLFTVVPVIGMALFFVVVVGPIEETVKWLAVRVGSFGTIDAVVDGVVYGAVAGLGFATIENALYISQGYTQAITAQSGQPIVSAIRTATSRAFVGPGHVLYSSFAGYYLGLAKFNPENAGPIVVKGILIAALIHATYNSLVTYLPLSSVAFLAFVLVFDGVVGYLLYRKIARYRSHYQKATAEGP
jgi:RsiW-degrading membrane proteinase PrsW (M82 family)